MMAADVAVVAAIPPWRRGVMDGTWWADVALFGLVVVSGLALAVGLLAYVQTGRSVDPTRGP